MTRRHLANVVLCGAAIPLVLWLDRESSLEGQLVLGAFTGACLWWMLQALPGDDVARVWGVVLAGVVIESFCTQVWGAYAYRLANVPMYVFFGHGMLCAAAKSGARLYRAERSRRVMVIGVAVVASLWAVLGLVLPERADVEGALFLPLFLPLLWKSERRLEHAHTFIAAAFVEFIGTRVHTWEWAATLPVLGFSAGNPPSVVAGGYCYFAVLGGLVVEVLRARLAAPAQLSP